MPIIIDEVVISVEVTNEKRSAAAENSASVGEKQAIINECVERVLDILRQKNER